MRVFVKICGMSTPQALAAAVTAGADAVGFVFAESPRKVTPKRARQLCRDLSPVVIRVAVMHHPTPDEWQRVAEEFEPDWLQTDVEDYANLDVPERFTRFPVHRSPQYLPKAVPDSPGGRFDGEENLLLFEAATSGQGIRADWSEAAALAAGRQLVLAGGLTPENVGEAIATVRPYGVDVSSGVESKRGVKDARRIAEFLQAVRTAELEGSNLALHGLNER
ncbi:MAG: phosphoribosylanthranilate isomerase [Gammaproteobacteria bacterium PRO9]|nr:phosphoribosylanthranilate isomerase [Gammaproteobacteria bacterium PRO9]